MSRRAIRQGGALLLATGVIGFASDLLPGAIDNQTRTSLVLDGANLLAGLIFFFIPSRLFQGRRSLILAVFAMADIAITNALGDIPAPTLGIWFIVIFVWIGAWHPPIAAVCMTPIAVAVYLVPFSFGAPKSIDLEASVVLVISVALLVALVIASNASMAVRAVVEQRRVLAALAKANVTDDLTTLGNRRFGNELIDKLQVGDVVAILDLDKFKQVNDQYGHSRGDQVLQELGVFLSKETDSDAQVARMGGEEFLLIFTKTPYGVACELVNKLVSDWRATLPLSTLSAGVALHLDNQSPSRTYHLADEALYLAKSRGRDQVVVAEETLDHERLLSGGVRSQLQADRDNPVPVWL